MIGSQFPSNSASSTTSCDNLFLSSVLCFLWIFECLSKEMRLDVLTWLIHTGSTDESQISQMVLLGSLKLWLSGGGRGVSSNWRGDSWRNAGLWLVWQWLISSLINWSAGLFIYLFYPSVLIDLVGSHMPCHLQWYFPLSTMCIFVNVCVCVSVYVYVIYELKCPQLLSEVWITIVIGVEWLKLYD